MSYYWLVGVYKDVTKKRYEIYEGLPVKEIEIPKLVRAQKIASDVLYSKAFFNINEHDSVLDEIVNHYSLMSRHILNLKKAGGTAELLLIESKNEMNADEIKLFIRRLTDDQLEKFKMFVGERGRR